MKENFDFIDKRLLEQTKNELEIGIDCLKSMIIDLVITKYDSQEDYLKFLCEYVSLFERDLKAVKKTLQKMKV